MTGARRSDGKLLVELEGVLGRLGALDALDDVGPGWAESLATLPESHPSFLEPESFVRYREYCRLDPSADGSLRETARRLIADRELLALTWHAYRALYQDESGRRLDNWPLFTHALGVELGAAPYLLVALGMVPMTQAAQAQHGVPPEVTRDTCLEVQCFANNHRDAHQGRWGILLNHIAWLRHYVAGRLYRLGRFEYKIEPYRGWVEAYRQRQSRRVVALAKDGQEFDAKGFIPIEGITDSGDGTFRSRLERPPGAVVGTLLSPRGMALDRRARLDRAEWQPVLTEGDLTLDMHIPSGGNMTPENCADSLRRAVEFFPRYFPDKPTVAVTCASWIYNTQFEEFMPDSNLAKHMQELYLYPFRSSGRDGLGFLFYADDVDPATARRDSSIRRAILDHLAAGNHLRAGGMFILNEDVPHYGTQQYRTDWPPAELQEGPS